MLLSGGSRRVRKASFCNGAAATRHGRQVTTPKAEAENLEDFGKYHPLSRPAIQIGFIPVARARWHTVDSSRDRVAPVESTRCQARERVRAAAPALIQPEHDHYTDLKIIRQSAGLLDE